MFVAVHRLGAHHLSVGSLSPPPTIMPLYIHKYIYYFRHTSINRFQECSLFFSQRSTLWSVSVVRLGTD